MTNVTVPDESNESSQDKAGGFNSHCGTGSVDRGHLRKRLLSETTTMQNIVETTMQNTVETPLSYFFF